jgi:exosortase
LLALPLRTWWPGLTVVALALGLHVVAFVIQQPRVSILALLAGLYGLMGLAWGPQLLRASFFPFFLLGFCVPLGSLIDFISVPLQIVVCVIVEFIAHQVLGIDVMRAGTQLYDPSGRFQYEVAAACSGIRSLVSIGTMAVIGAFLFYRRWWRRILLIAMAVPLAIAGNALRLLTIILSAEIGGQRAGDYVHEGGPLGIISLLPYVPAFLGLLAIGTWLSERNEAEPKRA